MKPESTSTPIEQLSKAAKPEAINKRLFDLCRHQRSELLDAELITIDEWTFLTAGCELAQGCGSPSPRRLEDYDALRARLEVGEELTRQIKSLGALIPCATGGTFENDPPDAIIRKAIDLAEQLKDHWIP